MKWSTIEHYLVSSLVSFVAGFLLTIVPFLQNMHDFHWQTGTIVATLLVCVRAGIKALIEYLVPQIKLLVAYLQSKQ